MPMKPKPTNDAGYATVTSPRRQPQRQRAVGPHAIASSKPAAYAHPPCIIPAVWLEGFRRAYPHIEDQSG